MWPTPRESAAPVRARVIAETGMTTAIRAGAVGSNVLISSDGQTLVFVGGTGGGRSTRWQLYRRRFTELHASPMAGTEGAMDPFFKPDGQWVGFFADGKLKKVPITGGAPVVLCDAEAGRGGWWREDGTIVFSPHSQPGTVLHRVPDNGGTPQALGSVAKNDVTQRWPQVLPGSRAVLYSGLASTSVRLGRRKRHRTAARWWRPKSARARRVPRALRSEWARRVHPQAYLFAIPFDLTRLETSGDPVPILEDVSAVPLNGSADFSVSDNGTLDLSARGRQAGPSRRFCGWTPPAG